MSVSTNNFDTDISKISVIENEKVVIVYTQWNKKFVDALVNGAVEIFSKHAPKINIQFIEVPGCIEIPFAIHAHYHKANANNKKPGAYIAFGVVIKGETAHFDYVCNSVTQGITILNTTQLSPTIYGILTVNNEQQITERLGGSHGHKGQEAAITALKMMHIKNNL
jgi:6,7-dimethyl-8-ribityllumazine synthase